MILKAFEKIVDIRKLIALDISLNGWMPITAEFFFGLFGIMIIGMVARSSLGIYLMLVSLNYIPPLTYALLIGNQKNAKKEARTELSKLKRYGPKGIRDYNLQQWFLVPIPFAMVISSLLQEFQKL